jgi:hypothetical protein
MRSGEETKHLALSRSERRILDWLLQSGSEARVQSLGINEIQHVLQCRADSWNSCDLARKTFIQAKRKYEGVKDPPAHRLADSRQDGTQRFPLLHCEERPNTCAKRGRFVLATRRLGSREKVDPEISRSF